MIKSPVVIALFHLYEAPEQAELIYGSINDDSDCLCFRGIDRQEAQGTFWGDGNVYLEGCGFRYVH